MSNECKKYKYIGVWHNKLANMTCVEHIVAQDILEAKMIMIYLMKYYGGNYYDERDIQYISQEGDNYYINYESILRKYRLAKKPIPIIPAVSNMGSDTK